MDDKILDKIKKCLRLARSSNANEAATALRQAQALMARHGITAADVAASDVDEATVPAGAGKEPPRHILYLANMVAEAFGADLVYGARQKGDRWHGQIEFFGPGSAAEIAGYAFEVLARQLNKDRRAYMAAQPKRIKRATRIQRGDLYARGWVAAVAEKVTPHERTEAEEQALKAYRAQRWPEPLDATSGRDNTRRVQETDRRAVAQGLEDGSKVQFHQGVRGAQIPALTEDEQLTDEAG